MKRILKIAVGALAFLVGIAVVGIVALRPTYDLSTAKSVCEECRALSDSGQLETKTLREVLYDGAYIGKPVRLKARFEHDAGYIFLYEQPGDTDANVSAAFDKGAFDCPETDKTLAVCTGYKSWYDSSVNVTVVGVLDASGKFGQFRIMCVEEVHPTDSELQRGKDSFEAIIPNLIEIFVWK